MMTTADILKKVRQIEIKTRGLSNHIFGGEYHSAFKGRGMSFSEVREYSYGDDVRNIDWNVTARSNTPYIKVFEEERELILMLLVDISASSLFGSVQRSKRELITEICAVLAFSAISNQDKVGVVFFSDKVERYIAPKKGKSHILFIIRELITMEPHPQAQTDIRVALRFLNNIMKKRTISFLLSDFISSPYQDALQIAARRHDLIGIQVYDRRDREWPDVGVIRLHDWESGQEKWVDTSSAPFRRAWQQDFDRHSLQNKDSFLRQGAAWVPIQTDDDYVKKLQLFFKARHKSR